LPLRIRLAAIPAEARPGWAVWRLIEAAGLARPACPEECRPRVRGANTPEERNQLLADLARDPPAI